MLPGLAPVATFVRRLGGIRIDSDAYGGSGADDGGGRGAAPRAPGCSYSCRSSARRHLLQTLRAPPGAGVSIRNGVREAHAQNRAWVHVKGKVPPSVRSAARPWVVNSPYHRQDRRRPCLARLQMGLNLRAELCSARGRDLPDAPGLTNALRSGAGHPGAGAQGAAVTCRLPWVWANRCGWRDLPWQH